MSENKTQYMSARSENDLQEKLKLFNKTHGSYFKFNSKVRNEKGPVFTVRLRSKYERSILSEILFRIVRHLNFYYPRISKFLPKVK